MKAQHSYTARRPFSLCRRVFMASIATLTTYPAVWLVVPYVLGTLEKDFFLVVVATLLVINLISTNLDALRILHQPLRTCWARYSALQGVGLEPFDSSVKHFTSSILFGFPKKIERQHFQSFRCLFDSHPQSLSPSAFAFVRSTLRHSTL